MREAWRRPLWEATSWTTVRGPAGAVFCEMEDLGVTVPSWQVLRMGDGRTVDMRDTCTGDIQKTLVRLAKDVYWQTCAKEAQSLEKQSQSRLKGRVAQAKVSGKQWSLDTNNASRHVLD